MKEGRGRAISGVAAELSPEVRKGILLGLGSGSTTAALLRELSAAAGRRLKGIRAVPTSMQIQQVAEELGVELVSPSRGVDLLIDGADQVDEGLNLVKGGGGALLKEKVLMSGARRRVVVADEEKFSRKLCMNAVRVPVEVVPFARSSVMKRVSGLGGIPHQRMLEKGYSFFTENGNVVLDTEFEPIEKPAELEAEIKCIPGVVENGIFTLKPIRVYRIRGDGTYSLHAAD